MKFLVDANVLSEPTKRIPNSSVVEWLKENEIELAVDSIILAKLRLGIVSLPKSTRRTKLEEWFEELNSTVRCLPWDAKTGRRWADLIVKLRSTGRMTPLMDSMIAATVLEHDLILATRNVRDFEPCGVRMVNPFGSDRTD